MYNDIINALVDHNILLRHLETTYGLKDKVLALVRSYLTERTQSVWIDKLASAPHKVNRGVPKGSVMGPLLFMLYVGDISDIKSYDLDAHLYGDDGQIYSSCVPHDAERLQTQMIDCFSNIKAGIAPNCLMLNPIKTEFLWLSMPKMKHLIN